MANNIIPFPSSDNLPAYLQGVVSDVSAFFANVQSGFPVLSIKGKTWALVRDGERRILPDPDDKDEPARHVLLTLLSANPHLSKVYYAKGYEDGSTEKPDCYSNDSLAPASDAQDPQSKTCAACPHNVWGSGSNGKGKKCQDSRRVAVAPSGRPDDAMLLRVPPASLKSLAEYATEIKRRNLPIQAVVTKVRFDPEEATPKLLFKPEGLLSEDAYQLALQTSKGDLVQQILGTGQPGEVPDAPKVKVEPEEVEEALEEAPKPKAKAKAKPAPEPEADDEDGTEEEAPKPKAKAKKAVATAAEPKDDLAGLNDEIDDILGAFDDD